MGAVWITFVGTTTVRVPPPIPGSHFSRKRARTVGRTASGAVYTYDKSVGWHEAVLQLRITESQRNDLLTFFDAETSTFTYNDSDGNAYTARFLESDLDQAQAGIQGLYDVRLVLELSAAGV